MSKFLNKNFLRFLAGFAGITLVSMISFLGLSFLSGISLTDTAGAVLRAFR